MYDRNNNEHRHPCNRLIFSFYDDRTRIIDTILKVVTFNVKGIRIMQMRTLETSFASFGTRLRYWARIGCRKCQLCYQEKNDQHSSILMRRCVLCSVSKNIEIIRILQKTFTDVVGPSNLMQIDVQKSLASLKRLFKWSFKKFQICCLFITKALRMILAFVRIIYISIYWIHKCI